MAVLTCLLECEPDRIHAARLATADPDRRQIVRQHDRVRAHVLAHAPRKDKIAPARFVRFARHALHALAVVDVPVAVLYEQPAEDSPEVALAGREAAPLAVAQDPDRLLLLELRESLLVVVRR